MFTYGFPLQKAEAHVLANMHGARVHAVHVLSFVVCLKTTGQACPLTPTLLKCRFRRRNGFTDAGLPVNLIETRTCSPFGAAVHLGDGFASRGSRNVSYGELIGFQGLQERPSFWFERELPWSIVFHKVPSLEAGHR